MPSIIKLAVKERSRKLNWRTEGLCSRNL